MNGAVCYSDGTEEACHRWGDRQGLSEGLNLKGEKESAVPSAGWRASPPQGWPANTKALKWEQVCAAE